MAVASFVFLLGLPLWIFLAHAIGLRWFGLRNVSRQIGALIAILVASSSVFVLLVYLERNHFGIGKTAFLVITEVLLAQLYFQVFNLSETARRIRILIGIRQGTGYESTASPIQIRIQRLLALHQIEYRGGKYFSRPTFLTFVAILLKGYEYFLFSRDS